MCLSAPKMPEIQPLELPEPVKPAEVKKINPAPPPPAKTATYLGTSTRGADKVSASPVATRGFSSLRIRPRKQSSTGLNLPY